MKAYIAAGWFSKAQEEKLNKILSICKDVGLSVYSPRDDFLYKEGMNPSEVFDANLAEIKAVDFVIASTEGKDMGTLFECGYAYASGKPIVYVYMGEGKFTLMLAESSTCVCTSWTILNSYLTTAVATGSIPWVRYKGVLE